MSVDDVLADREISHPLTRAMCAPLGDGAAAVLVVSEKFLQSCDAAVRERAVRIRACETSGGKYRGLEEPGLSKIAAEKAYQRAGLSPKDIDVAEVHDATSFSEIYQLEMLGFCAPGEGGPFIEEGRAGLSGDLPLNTSGGLVSKGHPIGATGLSMIVELADQLRGEAGERQVPNARLALAESGGGVIGFDEAVCVVTVLER
jgi:acetyl-CoA acetyltransferase